MQHRNFTRVAHAKSYAGGRLRNPFFDHEPRHINPWFLLVGISVISLGLFAAFLYAPFLQYNQLEVDGLTTLSSGEVEATVNEVLNHNRWLLVPGRQLFLMNSARVIKELDIKFNFASISLHRSGRHLVINAVERITQVTWLVGDKGYLLDLSGLAVAEASPEVLANVTARKSGAVEIPAAPGVQPTMPIIINNQAEEVVLGQGVLDVTRLTNVLMLDSALRERGLIPRSYVFEDSSQPWLTVQTDSIALLVDVTQSIIEAVSMFDTYRTQGNTSFTTLKYIDLRFGNHLYIQTK